MGDKRISFDREKFFKQFEALDGLAEQAISSFLESLPKLTQTIELAIQEQNPLTLEIAAHTLKGALSNFFAEPSLTLAWQLEQLGKGNVLDSDKVRIIFEELKIELERLVNAFSETSATLPNSNNKTILIVDDSEFDRRLFAKVLNQDGRFKTLEATTGDQCLEILNHKKIDLVLMDIVMPGSFGTEVLLKIRDQFNAIVLPIIMVTAKADSADTIGCLRSGANDYITKPVNFEVALSRINTHLKLAEVCCETVHLKEIAALNALITTYNHEINNPLTIALGCLNEADIRSNPTRPKLEAALWRIADIVKKIRSVTDQKEIEYQSYAKSSKLLKVK